MLDLKNLLFNFKNPKNNVLSAQDTIPYQRMYRDGICRVTDTLYSKTIKFTDINYQIAQNDDKRAIYEGWCDFLNYFDDSINFQLSFVNSTTNSNEYTKSIHIQPQNDAFNEIRTEYTQMLHNQLNRGNNAIVKTKYISFSIEAENIQIARSRLERIEIDIFNEFKKLGVRASSLNAEKRLKLFHDILHMDANQPFTFDWDMLVETGMSTKDFIVPSSFEFKDRNTFQTGDKIGKVSFLQILASDLSDQMLSDFLKLENNLVVTMNINSVDQMQAIKIIKRTLMDLKSMTIDQQKKAVRDGYDYEMLGSDLVTTRQGAAKFLENLQANNEKMFLLTFTIVNAATDKKELDSIALQVNGVVNKHNCQLINLDWQQEQGFMSALPLAQNQIEIQRALTTRSAAQFVPFTTQELFQPRAEALYYGLNTLSNNLIMVDRKILKNPNGLILGTPGSGKSFSAKREITNVFLVTNDDIIICDPESEYAPLATALQGQVICISPTSDQHINPMDINLNYSDENSPTALKSEFILSFCELIIGGKEGLSAIEKSVIDKSVTSVYTKYFANPIPENMPILTDLFDALGEQPEVEATRIRSALELYVHGSLNVFNNQTNINIDNRLVCFDIKQLGKQLKKLGMLIVQDQVWNRVTINRAEKRSTRYYMDEFHLLLKEEQTAEYSVEIWKRFRKWGGIPTAITQNVQDLLESKEVSNIFANSDFVYMLNQAGDDRDILAKQLKISPYQLSYVTNSGVGEGLLCYGGIILPFIDKFPRNTKLYNIMTTKLAETVAE